MPEIPDPATLRALAAHLQDSIRPSEVEDLLAHAEAWMDERVRFAALNLELDAVRLAHETATRQLEAARKQIEVLEQDRRWWQENAIKRLRRAEARRSGRPSGGRDSPS